MDLDPHLRLILLDIGDLVSIDLAVLQRNALGDLFHIRLGEGLVQRHLVNFLLLERRVRKLAGQIAVVGEKQQPDTVLIEASHRIDTLRAGIFHQFHDRLVGMRIVERSHVTLGLVEHQIDLLLALDTAVVEFHLVRRLDFRSQRRHDHPVDGHQPRLDEIVRFAARTDPRLGDETVQAYLARRFVGIVSGITPGLIVPAAE